MVFKKTAIFALGLIGLMEGTWADGSTITYQNKRGSLLTLQVAPDDTLTGTFTTAVASKDCQQAIGVQRPIVGLVSNNAMTFSVNYPNCGSVVSFTGHFEQNQSIIKTTALISHGRATIDSLMIGHDVFTQLPPSLG